MYWGVVRTYDVAVIGAGLMGCFAARALAMRGFRVAVLEKQNDVCMGISRANTAIVYAGYDMKPGTLKAELTVKGNATFEELCNQLFVDYKQPGSLMVSHGPRATEVLKKKYEQGLQNNVPGMHLLSGPEARALEPLLSKNAVAALFSETTGTVNPWQLCLAAAKDATNKGAEFFFEHCVDTIKAVTTQTVRSYKIGCSKRDTLTASVVINCAGINTPQINDLVAPVSFRLALSSGSYLVLDQNLSNTPAHIVFFEPEEKGKGATLVPTVEGNTLLGPSHEEPLCLDTAPGYATLKQGLTFVRTYSKTVSQSVPLDKTIRSFGTIRPNIMYAHKTAEGTLEVSSKNIHDFYVKWAVDTPGFLNVAGIKTPGLTCANELGKHISALVESYFCERGITPCDKAPPRGLFLEDPAASRLATTLPTVTTPTPPHDKIVCRCREVHESQVRTAIRESLGARTIDGVKRRVGCGLGRCQGAYCMERVMLILAEELGIDSSAVIKDKTGSWIIKPLQPDASPPRVDILSAKPPLDDRIHKQPSLSTPLFILGGGAAGLAAACAAVDAGLSPHDILVVDRLDTLGGILPQCTHHGFGQKEFGGTLSGPEFLEPLLAKFYEYRIPYLLNTTVTHINQHGGLVLAGAPTTQGRQTVQAKALIYAAGCREQTLGSLNVSGTRPSGIFTAGAAQRMVNLRHWDIGDSIAILGGGDVGMIMAGTLASRGKHVVAVIEQAAEVSGLKINRQRYLEDNNIAVLTNSTLSTVYGHERLTGVEVCTNNTTRTLEIDTLIVSVGLIPERDLLLPPLELYYQASESKHINSTHLSDERFFATTLKDEITSALSALPTPLYLAGNARRVHQYIEGVVADGTAAGKKAAAFLNAV